MSGALLLTARVVAGFTPGDARRLIELALLEVLILLAVSLLGSAVLPTLANGVVMLALFGLAWLGGILGFVATIPPGNELLANLGTAAGLCSRPTPSGAGRRSTSSRPASWLPPPWPGELNGPPFVSTVPMAPAMLAWALAYPAACLALAVAAFRRRDL